MRSLAASPVVLSTEAPEALLRVAGLLDALPADDPGPQLTSTLGGRVSDALPHGPVDKLVVYAPFHDAQLSALTAVLDRLQPKQLTVFVQAQTSVDGHRLEALLDSRRGRLAWCTDEHFRHGKLLEWTVDGQRLTR